MLGSSLGVQRALAQELLFWWVFERDRAFGTGCLGLKSEVSQSGKAEFTRAQQVGIWWNKVIKALGQNHTQGEAAVAELQAAAGDSTLKSAKN
ncbi:hypothetical protein [Microcoleus sp.]|uniref:hypothetical protein n=1 Tax=Microcoleus sp. TaxID=44472 RepID=UPI00403E8ECB